MTFHNFVKVKLRYKVLLYFIVISFVSITTASYIYFIETRNLIEANNIDSFRKIGQGIHYTLQEIIGNGIEHVRIFANNPVISSESAQPELKAWELRRLKELLEYEDVTLIDLQGNVIASTDYRFSGKWTQEKVFSDALLGRTSHSNVHFIPNPLRPIIRFGSPVYGSDEKMIGVIVIQSSMDSIWGLVDKVKIGNSGYVFALDRDFRIVSHPDKNRILERIDKSLEKELQKESTLKIHSENDKKYVIGYYTSRLQKPENGKNLDWTIVVIQEEKEALESLNSILYKIVRISTLLFLIILVIAFIFSVQITRPIILLKEATSKVSKGEFNIKIEKKSSDEIGELVDSFGAMALDLKDSTEKLNKYKQELEDKVAERTKELEIKNAELEKFNKMAIGRELKMIELKRKINELEKKQGDNPENQS